MVAVPGCIPVVARSATALVVSMAVGGMTADGSALLVCKSAPSLFCAVFGVVALLPRT